ncbi:MAG TPA: cytochrome c-type biogenesis CcmF C-terminal domain-containing protein, partial [Chloroflexota bacterium]|nr:cytochrome c-type biogenesis CcmF C-terminal domain-containing protein [Chloroflexota bacterium]
WNLTLVMLAYLLAVFGTFIVRSGVLTSVHAFAQSSIGPYFFAWLAISIAVSVGLLLWRLPKLQSEATFESIASREASFLFNNWLLIGVIVAVFSGTIFPIISEAVRGEKITVGPPFFGAVNGPIFLALMITMGIGPLLPWRRSSRGVFARNILKPAIAALALVIVLLATGIRNPGAVLGYGASGFVFATLVFEFYRGTMARRRVTGKSTLAALADLFVHHNRRYGGYLVHVGLVVAAVAIIGSQFYQLQRQVSLEKGQTATIGHYRLTFDGLATSQDAEKNTTSATLTLADGSAIYPGKSVWTRDDQNPTSEIVIRSTPFEDLYVVLSDWTPDNAAATFLLFVNPMVTWLWLGGIIVVIGTVITAWPHSQKRRAAVPVRRSAPLPAKEPLVVTA